MNAGSLVETVTFWFNAIVLAASIASAWVNLVRHLDDILEG
jgi:hypothetical protein